MKESAYVDLAGTMLDLGLAGFRILHVLFIYYQPVFRSADGLMNEAVSCLAGMDLHRIKQQLCQGDVAPPRPLGLHVDAGVAQLQQTLNDMRREHGAMYCKMLIPRHWSPRLMPSPFFHSALMRLERRGRLSGEFRRRIRQGSWIPKEPSGRCHKDCRSSVGTAAPHVVRDF